MTAVEGELKMVQSALGYGQKGVPVILVNWPLPNGGCSCGARLCPSVGKHPMESNWGEAATSNLTIIQSKWSIHPKANIGMPTGSRSGLIVIDVDCGSGRNGDKSLELLQTKYGPLPATMTAQTGNGFHFFFKCPDRRIRNNAGTKLGQGIDVRGEGGQVVLTPSLHRNGNRYRWMDDIAPAEMPLWMVELLADEVETRSAENVPDAGVISEGRRNSTLTWMAGKLRRLGLTASEMAAALWEFNCKRCKPPLERREVDSIARSISQKAAGTTLQTSVTDRRPDLVCLGDVEAVAVKWLCYPYLPIGKLTMLEGDPSAGKTFLALAMAAAITRGTAPIVTGGDQDKRIEPGNVLYLSAEDGIADTLRPRVDALNGDASRVTILRGTLESPEKEGDEHSGVVTLSDLNILESALAKTRAVLVVIDPLQAYLGAEVDFHRANTVRPVLAAIARIAEKFQCVVLIIRHLSKAQQSKAIYRGMGSIDITAAARSVLLAGCDPENPETRALVHIKSSLANPGGSLGYELTKDGRFLWTGPSELTAADLLAPEEGKKEGVSAVAAAKAFLEAALKDGPRLSKEVAEGAKQAGISGRTLRRAKEEMGIISRPSTFKGKWNIELPLGHQTTLDQ